MFLDHDLHKYQRITYSLLDYLRDIGGLFGAFNAIITVIVFVLNFNAMHQWLTSLLFRVQSFNENQNSSNNRGPDKDPT